MAERDKQGFKWVDGVLMKLIKDDFVESRKLVVLPAKFRQKVLTQAHEKCGHFSRKKVAELIRSSFIWPGMTADIVKHCKSCAKCQVKQGTSSISM